MPRRGTFDFEVTEDGNLKNNSKNVERLRRLWLDRSMVQGYYLGPGDEGDFDHGAWHVACHLVAASGVRRSRDGKLLWLEISYSHKTQTYFSSVSVNINGQKTTLPLDSADGRALLKGSALLGFVEGQSNGRISAKGVSDDPKQFNYWRRQDFDQPVDSMDDGGKIWEHWCTLRDIRTNSQVGTSVLTSYVSLTSALGDLFVPIICRGRKEYGHPDQLRATVKSGLTSLGSALWTGNPKALPLEAETLIKEADPHKSLDAIEGLDWLKPPQYFMFNRKIQSWNDLNHVKDDLDGD